jgi:hypothetical protein
MTTASAKPKTVMLPKAHAPRMRKDDEVKAQRIKIAAHENVELFIHKNVNPNTACDGKRTQTKLSMRLVGPAHICLVRSKKVKR